MKLWDWCFLFHDLYYKCFLALLHRFSRRVICWLTTRFNLSTREIPFLSFKHKVLCEILLFFFNESSAQKKNKQKPPEAITYIFFSSFDWYLFLYSYSIDGLLPSHFSHVRLCATPWTAAHQGSPSMGFSR